MGYRDDKRAMKQRIEQLEGELAASQNTVARLRGHMDEHVSDDIAEMLTKENLRITRELDIALGDAGIEAIADMLRQRLQNCNVSEVGRTLTCTWGTAALRIVRHDDRTELRLSATDPRSELLLACIGTGFAILGGPLLVGPVIAAVPWTAFALVPFALFAGYRAAIKLRQANIKSARTTLKGAFEAVIDLTQEHGQQPAAQRIDVGSEELAEEEALAAEEAKDAEEAAGRARI